MHQPLESHNILMDTTAFHNHEYEKKAPDKVNSAVVLPMKNVWNYQCAKTFENTDLTTTRYKTTDNKQQDENLAHYPAIADYQMYFHYLNIVNRYFVDLNTWKTLKALYSLEIRINSKL